MYKLLTYLLQSLRSSPFVCTNINFPSELHSYSNVILNIAQNMHIMNNCKRQRKNLFISNLVTKKERKEGNSGEVHSTMILLPDNNNFQVQY